MSFAVRAFRAALWQSAATWLQVALDLACVAVIARWIGPEGYGLVGAALLVVGLVTMFSDGALVESVVQRPTLEPGHVDATFWSSLGVAILGACAIVPAAEPLARWAGAPAAADLLIALALLAPISTLGAVPRALLARELRFGTLAGINTGTGIVANAVGIGAALSGAGAWSLVAMEAVRAVLRLALAWHLARFRPGWQCRRRHWRELRGFNATVSATYLLGHIDSLVPRALIGTWLGPTALGQYLLARRIFDEMSRLVSGPLAGIAMPLVARMQHERRDLQRMICGLYEASSLLAVPTFVGFALLAPVAVPFMFGAQWTDAVPAIQLLMLCALRTATGMFNIGILRGLGRADLPLVLLGAGALLAAMLIPALAAFGLEGAVMAILLRNLLTWPLGCHFIATVTGLSVRRQLAAGGAAMTSVVPMAGAVALWLSVLGEGTAPLTAMTSAVAIGATVYLLSLAVFSPSTLRRAGQLARAAVRRDGVALAAALGEVSSSVDRPPGVGRETSRAEPAAPVDRPLFVAPKGHA